MKILFEALKRDVFLYFDNIAIYDYFMIGIVLAGFLFFMLLALIFLLKSPVIGTLLLFLALGFLGYGSYFGYNFVNDKYRTRSLNIVKTKQLQYSNTFLVDLNLSNESNKTFKFCRANVVFYKIQKDKIKKFIAPLKPFKVVYADSREKITANSAVDINLTLYNFRPKDYNITAYSLCF